jgi:3-oxoacyl-[acyl-carrier protein] reductase
MTDDLHQGKVAEKHGGIDILVNNAGLHSAAYNKPSAELGIIRHRRLRALCLT